MRRPTLLGALALACLVTAATAAAHNLDHPVPSFAPAAPPSPTVLAGGTNASWELLGTISTGNPHTDLDFFTNGGETYAVGRHARDRAERRRPDDREADRRTAR